MKTYRAEKIIPSDKKLILDALPFQSDELVEVVIRARKKMPCSSIKKPSIKEPSKWAKIVQRVQNDPIHLAGYSEQLKKDMKEFRENFEFKAMRNG